MLTDRRFFVRKAIPPCSTTRRCASRPVAVQDHDTESPELVAYLVPSAESVPVLKDMTTGGAGVGVYRSAGA